MLYNFLKDERGEDLIEYGLLAAFIAAAALFVLTPSLKNALSGVFAKVVAALSTSF